MFVTCRLALGRNRLDFVHSALPSDTAVVAAEASVSSAEASAVSAAAAAVLASNQVGSLAEPVHVMHCLDDERGSGNSLGVAEAVAAAITAAEAAAEAAAVAAQATGKADSDQAAKEKGDNLGQVAETKTFVNLVLLGI